MSGRPRGLIDTGAILALVDQSDRWHRRCVEAFSTLRLPLATSAAVLTELFHLLETPQEVDAAWGFLSSGAVTVLPIDGADLPDLQTLMRGYSDRPMDFAGATIPRSSEGSSRSSPSLRRITTRLRPSLPMK